MPGDNDLLKSAISKNRNFAEEIMQLKSLKEREHLSISKDFTKAHRAYSSILANLQERELSIRDKDQINKFTDSINLRPDELKPLLKQYKTSQSDVLNYLMKELNLVVEGHYMRMWMVLGMTVFGLPFGVIFGMMMDNMAFLGIGLPMGMPIGIAVGMGFDSQAAKEGRQIKIDDGKDTA